MTKFKAKKRGDAAASSIGRGYANGVITLTAAEGTSEIVDVREVAGGSAIVSSGVTSLTLYAAVDPANTFQAAYDSAGSAITLTVASNQAVDLGSYIYGFAYVKFVANTAGTAEVFLKG